MHPTDLLTDAQLPRYTAQAKSVALCVGLELGGIFLGLSGVGIMVAGRPILGLLVMVTYWGVLFLAFLLGLSVVGILLVPVIWIVWGLLTTVSAAQAVGQHNLTLAARIASAAGGPPLPEAEPPAGTPIALLGALALGLLVVVGAVLLGLPLLFLLA